MSLFFWLKTALSESHWILVGFLACSPSISALFYIILLDIFVVQTFGSLSQLALVLVGWSSQGMGILLNWRSPTEGFQSSIHHSQMCISHSSELLEQSTWLESALGLMMSTRHHPLAGTSQNHLFSRCCFHLPNSSLQPGLYVYNF